MAGERCCGGSCSVRTGTKIIAVFCIIYTLCVIIIDISNIITLSRSESSRESNYFSRHRTLDYDGTWMYPIFSLAIVMGLVQLVLSSLLYAGACQNDKRKCLPWLWYNSVATALVGVTLAIFGIYITVAHDFLTGFLCLTGLTIGAAITIYFLNVVWHYIQDLREGVTGDRVWYHSPTQRTIA